MRNRISRMRAAAAGGALAALLAFTAGCATNPVTGQRQFSLVSADQELSIGKDGYQAMLGEYGVYDDARVAAYVDSVGKKLAAVSHLPNLEWHFTVLDDPVVNAFAMPGGYVYITRGILAHLNSEAQLAGVLGHEIGHVTARHTAAQITKQQIAGLGLGIAAALSGTFQKYSGAAQQALGLLFLKYSRDAETQADELGVEYAAKAGYGLQVRSRDYVRRMDGIVFGNDPRQGWFDGTRFTQPELGFEVTFPAGWATQNTRTAVTAGSTDPSGSMQLTLTEAKDRSALEFVQQLAASKQIAGFDGQRETIGGLNAWIGHIAVTQTDGTSATLCAAWLRDDARMFQLLGQDAAGDAPVFAAMRSFRKVTDPARRVVTPARVKVVTVPKTGPFATVIAGLGARQIEVDPESILNNVLPDETVAMGTLLKTVPRVKR